MGKDPTQWDVLNLLVLMVVDLLVRWLSVGQVVVDLLVQWVTAFLGGGSPVVDCDLCEFSGGYGRL